MFETISYDRHAFALSHTSYLASDTRVHVCTCDISSGLRGTGLSQITPSKRTGGGKCERKSGKNHFPGIMCTHFNAQLRGGSLFKERRLTVKLFPPEISLASCEPRYQTLIAPLSFLLQSVRSVPSFQCWMETFGIFAAATVAVKSVRAAPGRRRQWLEYA